MHRQHVAAARAGLAAGHHGGAWLAQGHQGGGGSVAGRLVLVLVAVLAVGAFTMLQLKARSRERSPAGRQHRSLAASDWRVAPPPSPERGEVPSGIEDRYGPDWRYRYLPGYDPRGRAR
ncbi:MAG: hypothetical protein JO037_04655 [Actinobacteria bacterium]|nr:hypothetical protein [Actinomycetota bacterium]